MTAPLLRALGWALLLSCGQGVALAAAFFFVQWLVRGRAPALRQRFAFGSQLVLLLLFVISAAALWRGWQLSPGDLLPRAVPTLNGASSTAAVTSAAVSARPELVNLLGWLDRGAVWCALVWLLGVLCAFCLFALRWYAVRRLLRNGVARSDLFALVSAVARELGINQPVRAVQTRVAAPAMTGWLRPVILLPRNIEAVLSREQLRAVIAHELAHVRRHDYAQHILQSLLGAVFFFHPVARWLGHCVQRAREEACDDLAVAVCRNPVVYARALERLESARSRFGGVTAALAVVDGELITRIRRLVTVSNHAQTPRSVVALLTAPLSLAVLIACALPAAVAPAVPVAAARFHNSLWKVNASDNAGKFTVTVIRDRVLAATIAGKPVPLERMRQTGNQLHFLRADGSTDFTIDVRASGIHWSPRRPTRPSS